MTNRRYNDCEKNELSCTCNPLEIDLTLITTKIEAVNNRIDSVVSKLDELIDLLTCDDCDCEDGECTVCCGEKE